MSVFIIADRPSSSVGSRHSSPSCYTSIIYLYLGNLFINLLDWVPIYLLYLGSYKGLPVTTAYLDAASTRHPYLVCDMSQQPDSFCTANHTFIGDRKPRSEESNSADTSLTTCVPAIGPLEIALWEANMNPSTNA